MRWVSLSSRHPPRHRLATNNNLSCSRPPNARLCLVLTERRRALQDERKDQGSFFPFLHGLLFCFAHTFVVAARGERSEPWNLSCVGLYLQNRRYRLTQLKFHGSERTFQAVFFASASATRAHKMQRRSDAFDKVSWLVSFGTIQDTLHNPSERPFYRTKTVSFIPMRRTSVSFKAKTLKIPLIRYLGLFRSEQSKIPYQRYLEHPCYRTKTLAHSNGNKCERLVRSEDAQIPLIRYLGLFRSEQSKIPYQRYLSVLVPNEDARTFHGNKCERLVQSKEE